MRDGRPISDMAMCAAGRALSWAATTCVCIVMAAAIIAAITAIERALMWLMGAAS